MKIYAPVKDANGTWATVRFVNGVGETDDPHLIKWFKTHGYKVAIEDKPVEDIGKQNIESVVTTSDHTEKEDNLPDFEAMTPNELRNWAKANGFGDVIKNTRNKEKLIEILRG